MGQSVTRLNYNYDEGAIGIFPKCLLLTGQSGPNSDVQVPASVSLSCTQLDALQMCRTTRPLISNMSSPEVLIQKPAKSYFSIADKTVPSFSLKVALLGGHLFQRPLVFCLLSQIPNNNICCLRHCLSPCLRSGSRKSQFWGQQVILSLLIFESHKGMSNIVAEFFKINMLSGIKVEGVF